MYIDIKTLYLLTLFEVVDGILMCQYEGVYKMTQITKIFILR